MNSFLRPTEDIARGPLRVVLYNEAYIPIASEKHPALMGSTWAQGWPEAAYEFGPHFEEAFMTGKATAMVDTIFFLNRHGYLEEYVKYSRMCWGLLTMIFI